METIDSNEQQQSPKPFERSQLPGIVTKLLMDYEIELLLGKVNGHFGAEVPAPTPEIPKEKIEKLNAEQAAALTADQRVGLAARALEEIGPAEQVSQMNDGALAE